MEDNDSNGYGAEKYQITEAVEGVESLRADDDASTDATLDLTAQRMSFEIVFSRIREHKEHHPEAFFLPDDLATNVLPGTIVPRDINAAAMDKVSSYLPEGDRVKPDALKSAILDPHCQARWRATSGQGREIFSWANLTRIADAESLELRETGHGLEVIVVGVGS